MTRRRPVDVAALLAFLGIKGRRRGSEWWACCPFHEEREPSWQIHDNADDLEHAESLVSTMPIIESVRIYEAHSM